MGDPRFFNDIEGAPWAEVQRVNGPDYVPRGLIFQAVSGLEDQPSFAGVINLAGTAGDLSAFVSNLTETFARVYLANPRHPIGFVHSVTAPSALRMLAPYLAQSDVRLAARYAWQACAALYAWYGVDPPVAGPATIAIGGDREELVDRAVGVAERGPKVPPGHVAEVAEVLPRERFVEVVPGLDIRAHRLRQRPVRVEGAAGGDAHDAEGARDDDPEEQRGGQEPPQDEAEHRWLSARC